MMFDVFYALVSEPVFIVPLICFVLVGVVLFHWKDFS